MTYQEFRVSYATWVAVKGTLPTYYIAQAAGYFIYAVGTDQLIWSILEGTEDIADFEAKYKTAAVAATSKDDALILGLVAGGTTLENLPTSGPTSLRPVNPPIGTQFFDTNLGIPCWMGLSGWLDASGSPISS